MALYNIANKELYALEKTTFTLEGLQERYDLQEAIKKNIDIIASDCLVISEEFSDWEDSRRRIDLLAIDKQANLVVIELKRDETGGSYGVTGATICSDDFHYEFCESM